MMKMQEMESDSDLLETLAELRRYNPSAPNLESDSGELINARQCSA